MTSTPIPHHNLELAAALGVRPFGVITALVDGASSVYVVTVSREGRAVGCSCPHATHRAAHCKHRKLVDLLIGGELREGVTVDQVRGRVDDGEAPLAVAAWALEVGR